MTEQEAIELLQNLNVKLTDMAGHKTNGIEKIFGWNEITAICEAINALEEVQQYRAIGTVEECRAAVEKMKPKKVIDNTSTDDDVWYQCPSCKADLTRFRSFYCGHCGQKLEW